MERRLQRVSLFVLMVQMHVLRPIRGVTLTYPKKKHALQSEQARDELARDADVGNLNGTVWKQRLLDELEMIRRVRAEAQLEYASEGRPVGSKPRMGVCMTGQMGRFELTSKLENLVAVNLERYAIDIVMVLAPCEKSERVVFSNPKSDPGGRRDWSAESIKGHILRRFRNRRDDDMRIVVDASKQAQNPFINHDYLKISNKPALGASRVESHVRQWLALVQCWKHFSILERRGPAYDVFVKVRDDSFVLKWWPIRESEYKNHVVISECLGFGGYNDKVAVVDAMYAETYFTRPIFDYYFHYGTLRLNKGNPESLLRAVLNKYLVSVRRVKVDSMPIFTNRIETSSNTSVCFVFDSFKVGRNPACWPKSCLLRQQLYCAKCPLLHRVSINLTAYFDASHGRESCRGPNHAACKLLRRRLRRHQKH